MDCTLCEAWAFVFSEDSTRQEDTQQQQEQPKKKKSHTKLKPCQECSSGLVQVWLRVEIYLLGRGGGKGTLIS